MKHLGHSAYNVVLNPNTSDLGSKFWSDKMPEKVYKFLTTWSQLPLSYWKTLVSVAKYTI